MELVGEDERIQALFRELKLEDERVMPRFATVWNRAHVTLQPRRAFKLSFVAVTLVLLCTLVSLAWWSRQWQGGQIPDRVAVVAPSIPKVVAPIAEETNPAPPKVSGQRNIKSQSRKFVAPRHTKTLGASQTEIATVTTISSWQSPTSALLRSPGDEMLTSLPQLNENANELKSFLPNREK